MSEEDFPSLTEFTDNIPMNPILAMSFMHVNPYPVNAVDPGVKPTDRQRTIKAGDKCVVSCTDNRANNDLVAVEILDPASHADAFPDWEDRVMGSFLLTKWISDEDNAGAIGWFDMTRMVQVTEEQYTEMVTLMEKSELEAPPEWLREIYGKYLEELSDLAPAEVSKMVKCPGCGSYDVEIHATRLTRLAAPAVQREVDGRMVYGVGTGEPAIDHKIAVHLHCEDCGMKGILSDDEHVINV